MSETAPTYHQIQEQHSKRLQTGQEEPAVVLVPSSDGRNIDTGYLYPGSDIVYKDLIDPKSDVEPDHKPILKREAVSDQYQQKLAVAIGGRALRAEGAFQNYTKHAEGVKYHQEAKRQAQQDGRGEDSIYHGQQAGQSKLEMDKYR